MHLVYALKDDVLTHVSDVERGLKCGCRCPYCDEELIARKGQKKIHHFAHQSGSECEHAYESSLHLMAKEILSKAKKIFLPWAGIRFPSFSRPHLTVQEEGEVIIEHVELEKRFRGVIPDVVIYVDGNPIFVEIFVTHPIDDKKLEKLRELGIPTIEIDLSYMKESITEEELSKVLIGESLRKEWKYHPDEERVREELYQSAYSLPISELWQGGYEQDIVSCPITGGIKPIWSSCRDCKHYIARFGDHILCDHEPYKPPKRKKRRESVEEPEPVNKPEPVIKQKLVKKQEPVKEPEPEKPKKPKKIFQSFDDRDYKKKMKSLYEQMEKERKTIKPEPPKPASPSTIEVAMRILMEADYLATPGKELHIDSAELGDGLDIILHTQTEDVCVTFSPDESDGHTRTLFVDLSMMDKFVTRKRFTEELINNVSVKQWLNEKAP